MKNKDVEIEIKDDSIWVYYINKNEKLDTSPDTCGKWMYFYKIEDYDFVKKIALNSIENRIVKILKHRSYSYRYPILNSK